MEKTKLQEQNILRKQSSESTNREIWDCGSSLYDSFELRTFQKQLDSAICSRSLSMPHISDRRLPRPPPLDKKPASKIFRSFHKLFRAVFRPKSSCVAKTDAIIRCEEPRCVAKTDAIIGCEEPRSKEGFYVVYGRPPALPKIPETGEFDGLSPEIKSLVRRTASERFSTPANYSGIHYCS